MSLATVSLLLSTIVFASFNVEAKSIDVSKNDLIYGADNRHEVDDYFDREFIDKAKSVAMRVPTNRLYNDPEDQRIINFPRVRLNQLIPQLCKEERFIDQLSVGNCSGFLVAPNKLVTAGHCIMNQSDCDSNRWVFDFKEGTTSFKRNNVYSCKRIIKQKYIYTNREVSDYAIIELDRNVEGRTPLAYRKGGMVPKEAPLLVIGHPLGLPMKITDGGKVASMNDVEQEHKIRSWFLRRNYFTANLDTYGGNSGSPVFNQKSGQVEGILIQGADDFTYNSDNECFESKHFSDSHLNSYEKVMRINKVEGLD